MEEKKLTDDELLRLLEIFAKDDESNGVRLLAEGALDLINRLQRENANVIAMNDTLYSEKVTLKSELKKEHAEHEEFTKKANAEIERLKLYLENEKNWGKIQTEQAVKDTAKEICDLILEHWEKKQFVECDWLRVAIAEKYGVEVE